MELRPSSSASRHPLALFDPDLFLIVVGHEAPVVIAPDMPSPHDPAGDARR
jgi:hypothetical protein